MASFTVAQLRCEYRENPLGIDELRPRLAWQMRTRRRGARQSAFQILARDEAGQTLWDSGKIESDQSTQIEYAGPELRSRQRVTWQVRVWDEGGVSVLSRPAWWEMGLLEPADWTAGWIQGGLVGGPRTIVPAPLLRKSFTLAKPVAAARLYVSALGLFEARLNGQPVGEDALAPGWTEYAKRVRYHVHDVGSLLVPGENVIGALLGDGWYCGHVGFQGRQRYGERPRLIAQLEVVHPDGSRTTLGTDGSWAVAYGPLLQADLLMGEHWDARLEMSGWDAPGFDAAGWQAAETWQGAAPSLVARNGPAIRRIQELAPVADPQPIEDFGVARWLFDFGQNLVGVVRLQATLASGVTLTLRHAEVLDADGRIYTANLRSAQQTDIYTSRGGAQVYEPRFTFHGFRYVEVHGYPGAPPRDLLTAVVIHSDMPPTGAFSCSNPLINQLQRNIVWGQKGNFVDVPTDCPQRDERLGWTGDAQVFAPTAAFNMDVAAFFSKWQQDLADAQHENGRIPPIAPDTRFGHEDGGPAWADAIVIVPWTMYQRYGDARLLARHYASMKAWMAYLAETSPGRIRAHPDGVPRQGYGDWLALDGSGGTQGATPRDLIGTAYYAQGARLMGQIAQALGKTGDAKRYARLFEAIRRAFIHRFVTDDGLLIGQTQTACALALRFGLLPAKARSGVFSALARDIAARGNRLSTGFVGTPHLPFALSENGRADIAYALLNQRDWPSWLYSVTQGATTIWERWDGWTKDKGFQTPSMNSFNHYAYGAIGAWLYAVAAGIDVDETQPGFKRIMFRPHPGGGLTAVTASLDGPFGRIESAWRARGAVWRWRVVVPPNSTALAHVPARENAAISADGGALVARNATQAIYALEAGAYAFVVK
ncbi:MAG TPA: family 78 glycoside hydrolase catalytic domain [Thermoflexales bacterium]|nr:family 78 glycoside hydrolase catalytic domain [Thermoflexales bacterium]